jgi:hypothetical protein
VNAKLKILKQYVKLRTSLEQERADIQSRLSEIEAVLGTEAAPQPASTAAALIRRGPGRPTGTRSRLSAAGKARIIAATKARWAKVKAEKGQAGPKAEKKPRRKVSAAGRARIAAAARARWARVKAEKAK